MSNRRNIRFVDPDTHARRSAAVAGTILEASQAITGPLFAGRDPTSSIELNAPAPPCHFTIGLAAGIEKAGGIPCHATVDLIVLIEGKPVDVVIVPFRLPLGLGELRSNILDETFATPQVDAREWIGDTLNATRG
jgi:hypothetical protein